MKLIKAGIILALLISGTALALPFTYNWSSGSLAASANFAVVGGNLQVTLTNTSAGDVMAPVDVLTAVFFDISGSPLTLTPISGVLGGGSTVFFGPDGGGNVGGEWAFTYDSSIPSIFGKSPYGIGSAGFGIFGTANFGGPNLEDPLAVNGLNYGILSAGDNTATGNAKVTGGVPLIKNQVIFTLSGIPFSFDPQASINNVDFVYGTDIPEVPEPASILLLGSGLLGAAGFARLRLKK